MCGIVGAINRKIDQKKAVDAMGHRGPDEQNGYSFENVDFFHLRLSIVDLHGGKQPMHLHDRYSIIFNGEIYNHLELRKQFALEAQSTSDTETLLLLYEKLGVECFQHMDGMFALAILDKQERTVLLARDRAGKKPLYIYQNDGVIFFASELNCIKSQMPVSLNTTYFNSYLRVGSFYGCNTPYQEVRELGAGSIMHINCNSLSTKEEKWWDIADYYAKPNQDDEATTLATLDRNLHSAVKRRLLSSDLEVGCFLSGGIDSGLVTAVASEYTNNLKTFTVSFQGEFDEAPLAKEVADKYNTDHTEISIGFDELKQDLPNIIANYGEPFFDSSAVPSYYVSKEAKKYVTVILNGDGADELFGGYRRYVPFAKYDFFKSPSALQHSANAMLSMMPLPSNKKSKYNYLHRMMGFASKKGLELYLSAGVDIFEGYEKYLLNNNGDIGLEAMRQEFKKVANSNISGLSKIMHLDFTVNLFSDLLVKMDIANMAHSLEGRSPFLSKEMLEYAPGMADKFKINGSTTKYALRELSKKYLPQNLQQQPKRGFEIPLKQWVNTELKEMVGDYLLSQDALSKQFLNGKFLADLVSDKVEVPAEKRAKMLWTLMSMEIWNKEVNTKNIVSQ
jgi:asparagine synthase (glutamine-hydrolysing)